MHDSSLNRSGQADAATEFARFLSLFDALIEQTFAFADVIDNTDVYAAVPIDSDANFLGARVNKITIGALLRHFILAESHWFERLAAVSEGDALPFPDNAALLDGIKDGRPLIESYRTAYRKGRDALETLSPSDLTKTLQFAGRGYTVMGFLWTIHSHHAFHLGQIDLLLRQQNIEPPEYMEWPESAQVIG